MKAIRNGVLLLLVLLSATELYRVFLVVFSISSFVYNIIFTLFAAVIAGTYFDLWFRDFNKSRKFRLYCLVIFFWPLLVMLYNQLFYPGRLESVSTWLGRYSLAFLIFLSFYAWVTSANSKVVEKFLLSIWVVVLVGIVLSFFFPELFKILAVQSDKIRALHRLNGAKERAMGFNLQSTVAAFSILSSYFLLFAYRGKTTILLFLATFGGLIMTGSRAGVLSYFFLNILAYIFEAPDYKLISFRKFTNLIVILPVIASVPFIFTLINSDNYALKRLDLLNAESRDQAVDSRLEYTGSYIEYIVQSPVFGFGPSYSEILQSRGILKKSSHNALVELSFDFGIAYVILLFYALLRVYFMKPHLSTLFFTVIVILFGLTHAIPMYNPFVALFFALIMASIRTAPKTVETPVRN